MSYLWIPLLLLAAWSLAAVLAYRFQRFIAFPSWMYRGPAPAESCRAAGLEEISIVTDDGETLTALWKPPSGAAPVIISFHGIGGGHWLNGIRFASGGWGERGYGVLAIALRGYHGSSGVPSEIGFMCDVEAAVAEARKRAPLAHHYFHGHSLGSALATAAAARFPCKILLLESAFTTLPDVGQRWYPILPVKPLLRHKFPTEKLLRSTKAERVFILHGTRDRMVPEFMGRKLAAACEKAVYMPLKKLGHNGLAAASDQLLVPHLFEKPARRRVA